MIRAGVAAGRLDQTAADAVLAAAGAGTHIERIYAKTGASNRSTVTLFAL